jgi:hypothetical protein
LKKKGSPTVRARKLPAAPGTPEIDFRLGDLGSFGQEPVPLVVSHPYVTPHNGIVHLR